MQVRCALILPDRIKINPAIRKSVATALRAAFKWGRNWTVNTRLSHITGFDDHTNKHEDRGDRQHRQKDPVLCLKVHFHLHPQVAVYTQPNGQNIQYLLLRMYHRDVNAATEFNKALNGVLPGGRPSWGCAIYRKIPPKNDSESRYLKAQGWLYRL